MKKITQEELEVFLRKHKLWLEDKEGGERLELVGYDLSWSNLEGSNLEESNLEGSNLSRSNLKGSNLSWSNLEGSNLSLSNLEGSNLKGSNLSRSNLKGSNLEGSNLDFSCLPLWCGGLDVHLDDRQLAQIAYHLVKNGLYSKNASEETKAELSKIVDFANKFHRVKECGKIEVAEN